MSIAGPLAVIVIIVVCVAVIVAVIDSFLLKEYRVEAEKRTRVKQQAREIAAKEEAEQARVRRAKQQCVEKLGAENSGLVESAQAAVQRIVTSEAARSGWLGDVDFTADIAGIIESLKKAHELRKVAQQLSALDKLNDDDRKILTEARSAYENLETTAAGRIKLLQKCAEEAELIDESLRQEREDARTSEQRAQLHAELSSMIYGIEAAPSVNPVNSAADAVIARVQAYREIKSQIQLSRG